MKNKISAEKGSHGETKEGKQDTETHTKKTKWDKMGQRRQKEEVERHKTW